MQEDFLTKSMIARLVLMTAVFCGLVIVAIQGWGAPGAAISESAVRPVAASLSSNAASFEPQLAGQTRESSRGGAARAQGDDDQDPGDGDDSVTLTLLHNNDGESKLLPNVEGGFPGIARFAATWVELGRESNADILLRVSSGDNFLASKEFAAGLAREGQPLYDSIALRGLYEAMSLGNHDFDFGPDVTARFIEGFRLNENSDPVTFVAANIDVSAEPALQALADEGRLAPSTIFTDATSGLSVGVIGAITPRLANISSPRNVVVDPDVAGAVNAEAQVLMDQGVDRIVLVSHLQGLAEDRELVPNLSGIDIVVAGGGDELLKNDGDSCQVDEEAFASYPLRLTDADGIEVPVVTTPGGYRCIGKLDVTFNADGEITAVDGSSIGVPLDGDPEEFAMARVEEPLAAALAELEQTVIGTSEVDLDGRRNTVRTSASNVGELLADAILATGQDASTFGAAEPQVAIQNGGGIRNDAIISAGEITESDSFDIAPFANFVVTGEVSRDRLKEVLEVAVAGLPGAEGTFPQIAGMTIQIDASQPAHIVDSDGDCALIGDPGSRIQNVTLADGTEIVSEGQVVRGNDIGLATIDFLANGGDCYPLSDLDFTTVGTSYQQALSTFVRDGLDGSITEADYPTGGSRITIVGLDGDPAPTPTPSSDDSGATTDGTTTDDSTTDDGTTDDGTETDELPNTGMGSWLVIIVAMTIAAAGALIFVESQRAGWLSLTNRLRATRAWFPTDID